MPLREQYSAARSQTVAGDVPSPEMNIHRFRVISREEQHQDGTNQKEQQQDPEASIVEAKLEGTHGQPLVSLTPFRQRANGAGIAEGLGEPQGLKERGIAKTKRSRITTPGIKKQKSGKQGAEDTPPTPWGCEWRKTDDGWNLWRYWSEREDGTGEKIKKSRYAGYLSRDAWQVMRDYDYETFVSIIGQRLRRYGQR